MVTITHPFWNAEEARLRAGGRVVVFLIASVVVGEALLRLRSPLTSLLPVIYGSAVEAVVYYTRRSTRLRRRPLPQRPHRLDQIPDELTGETTSGPPARHRLREGAVRRAAIARPDCPQDR